MALFIFFTGCVAARLPELALFHAAWMGQGSPLFIDELNSQVILSALACALVVIFLFLRRTSLSVLFFAGFFTVLSSAIVMSAQSIKPAALPAATVARTFFILASEQPVYLAGRGQRSHWEWEWKVINSSGEQERIAVPNHLGTLAVADDTCLLADVDTASPIRTIRSFRLVSAGDGSGSWVNADANRGRCFAMKR
jgi:hypothetical protein